MFCTFDTLAKLKRFTGAKRHAGNLTDARDDGRTSIG